MVFIRHLEDLCVREAVSLSQIVIVTCAQSLFEAEQVATRYGFYAHVWVLEVVFGVDYDQTRILRYWLLGRLMGLHSASSGRVAGGAGVLGGCCRCVLTASQIMSNT